MPKVNCGRFNVNYIEAGDGFPIVLIHGLAGDHTAWLPQIEIFKERYRVIAMDNPGSGESSPVDAPCTTEDLADTMLALMEGLEIEKAHVVGRSLGGLIGQHMALRAPDRSNHWSWRPPRLKWTRSASASSRTCEKSWNGETTGLTGHAIQRMCLSRLLSTMTIRGNGPHRGLGGQ